MNKRTIIIAEVGVNHNGSIEKAKKLILAAKKCHADYVKFQFFHAEKLVLNNCDLAEYQKRNSQREKNQLSLLKKLEFNENTVLKLKEFAKKKEIKFFCSIFSEDDISFLNKINETFFKIPSGEINNIFILDKAIKLKKKLIISTGASSLKEISKTINYLKSKIKKNFNKKVILMHCVSKYPTKINELNLNFIKTLRKKFKLKVGFSDHTTSIDTGLISVMLGAEFIEKHITLNNNSKGPDHKASLNPKNFKIYVKKIRQLDEVLGSIKKKLTSEEIKNKKVIRKSLVAKQDIKIGEIFSSKNLTAKRPGDGKSPMQFLKLIGTRAKKDIKKNQII